jgi:hypothetical protein
MTLLSSDCCLSWGLDFVWGGRAGILKKNHPVDLATASSFGSTDNLFGGKLGRLKHSAITHHQLSCQNSILWCCMCGAKCRFRPERPGAHLRSLKLSHSRGLSAFSRTLSEPSWLVCAEPYEEGNFWAQGGFKTALKRIERGSHACDTMSKMILERAAVEARQVSCSFVRSSEGKTEVCCGNSG